jgi:hypothetical protein
MSEMSNPERVGAMVERISTPGLSGVVGVRPSNPISVSVQGGQRKPEKDVARDRGKKNPYAQNPRDDAVLVGRYRQAGERASPEQDADVAIDRSTSMLLADDLGALIRRASANIRLLSRSVLGASEESAADLTREFTEACLDEVRLAILLYVRQRGGTSAPPAGLVFSRMTMRIDHGTGRPGIELGDALFAEKIDLNPVGVVFDIRGSGAVHEARPGVFVDIGEHGAGTANTLIETVRRDVRSFDAGVNTEGVIVVIRADRSDYSGGKRAEESLGFDMIIPFASPK